MKTKKGKDVPKPENYDFPDPDAGEEEMYWGRDAATYLHKAAEYEKWAERARECGRDELVIMYESAANDGSNGIRIWKEGKGDGKMQKMRKRNKVCQNKKGKMDAGRTGTGYNHAC